MSESNDARSPTSFLDDVSCRLGEAIGHLAMITRWYESHREADEEAAAALHGTWSLLIEVKRQLDDGHSALLKCGALR